MSMRFEYKLFCGGMLGALAACSSSHAAPTGVVAGAGGAPAQTGSAGSDSNLPPQVGSGGSLVLDSNPPDAGCPTITCADLGWACGYMLDACDRVVNCADEGRSCSGDQVCSGGLGSPTVCVTGAGTDCTVCSALPQCDSAAQPTRITGRVISPGRTDDDTGNQIGVPNAIVYILRGDTADTLPAMPTGIPDGGTSCDRCEDQDLGPVLVGAVTDAAGNYTLEGNVPIDRDFILVVKAGKFRRASTYHLAATAACQTTNLPTTLPDNPTRLPRNESDGLAAHLPHVAVSTGQIDAMECVFEKLGISHAEFGNPGSDGSATPRIHLYRGGPNSGSPPGSGMRIDDATPHNTALYTDLARLESYDMVVADCEGGTWDSGFTERDASGAKVLEYVNRGGRLFASHLSFSWLHQNGTTAYTAEAPLATGLAAAATWSLSIDSSSASGPGKIAIGRPLASPRIDAFAAWMSSEGISSAPDYTFTITQPRSQATALGASTEEFVYRTDGNNRTQQFSFNTPYGAPEAAACGRVAYSGFHVSAGSGSTPFANTIFPALCTGDLTSQEKILLYMLFDLGACVGAPPPPPPCVPIECDSSHCGFAPDGCGGVIDCGPCRGPA
jgi:hypothetical protein